MASRNTDTATSQKPATGPASGASRWERTNRRLSGISRPHRMTTGTNTSGTRYSTRPARSPRSATGRTQRQCLRRGAGHRQQAERVGPGAGGHLLGSDHGQQERGGGPGAPVDGLGPARPPVGGEGSGHGGADAGEQGERQDEPAAAAVGEGAEPTARTPPIRAAARASPWAADPAPNSSAANVMVRLSSVPW